MLPTHQPRGRTLYVRRARAVTDVTEVEKLMCELRAHTEPGSQTSTKSNERQARSPRLVHNAITNIGHTGERGGRSPSPCALVPRRPRPRNDEYYHSLPRPESVCKKARDPHTTFASPPATSSPRIPPGAAHDIDPNGEANCTKLHSRPPRPASGGMISLCVYSACTLYGLACLLGARSRLPPAAPTIAAAP